MMEKFRDPGPDPRFDGRKPREQFVGCLAVEALIGADMGEQRLQVAAEAQLPADAFHFAADTGDFGNAEGMDGIGGHRCRGVAGEFGRIKRRAVAHGPAAGIDECRRQISFAQIGLPQAVAGIDAGFDNLAIGGGKPWPVVGKGGRQAIDGAVEGARFDRLGEDGIDLLEDVLDDQPRMDTAGGMALLQPRDDIPEVGGKPVEPGKARLVIVDRGKGGAAAGDMIGEFDMEAKGRVERDLPGDFVLP